MMGKMTIAIERARGGVTSYIPKKLRLSCLGVLLKRK